MALSLGRLVQRTMQTPLLLVCLLSVREFLVFNSGANVMEYRYDDILLLLRSGRELDILL